MVHVDGKEVKNLAIVGLQGGETKPIGEELERDKRKGRRKSHSRSSPAFYGHWTNKGKTLLVKTFGGIIKLVCRVNMWFLDSEDRDLVLDGKAEHKVHAQLTFGFIAHFGEQAITVVG